MPAKPKPATTVLVTDLDYDLAMLGDTLTDDALQVLDSVLDARDTARDFLGLLATAQRRLEAGAGSFEVRDQVANDIIDLATAMIHAAHELGGATFLGFESDI